jgi:hypothetical protein
MQIARAILENRIPKPLKAFAWPESDLPMLKQALAQSTEVAITESTCAKNETKKSTLEKPNAAR